ncbi:DNA-processing protein DprA [Streptomyces sp. NBC_01450]|uniref:DNA-processing protein DprA n=1 Tax=Streptomyces sp. NBC_01450 TaxID=2903871 RepID=UPI003FCEB724
MIGAPITLGRLDSSSRRASTRSPRIRASASSTCPASRACSGRSKAAPPSFATAVAEAGHTVTATLAYGVDSAAHRAAALAGRATLAVLPRRLDRAHRTPTPSC